MKDITLLVWLTQLGLSVVSPITVFTLMALWLQKQFDIGVWIVIVGIAIGLFCSVNGFINSVKMMKSIAERHNKKSDEQTIAFNDHK